MGLVKRITGRGLGVIDASMQTAKHASSRALSGLSGAAPTGDISLQENAGPVLNQFGTQSCLSQALLDAAVTTASARYSKVMPLPSRRLHYFLMRRKFQRPVVDGGGYMFSALQVIDEYGFTDEKYFTWSALRIDEKPSIDLVVGSWSKRHRHNTFAIDSQDELDRCLHSQRACVICVKVDELFTQDNGPSVVEGPPQGPIRGGHALEVLAVRWVAGRRQYMVKNSWGTSWRLGGYTWLDEWWIQHAYDIAVVDLEQAA